MRRKKRVPCAQEGCLKLIPGAPCSELLCSLCVLNSDTQRILHEQFSLSPCAWKSHLIRSTALGCQGLPKELGGSTRQSSGVVDAINLSGVGRCARSPICQEGHVFLDRRYQWI